MSVNDNDADAVQLAKLNEHLTASLERCHDLLEDCRSKLAANCNEPLLLGDDEESREA